jgi:hypothetical protein
MHIQLSFNLNRIVDQTNNNNHAKMKFNIQVQAIVKEIVSVTRYVKVTYVNKAINFKFKLKKRGVFFLQKKLPPRCQKN